MALLRVICWAIIFITRIRLPPGKSLATIMENHKLSKVKQQVNFDSIGLYKKPLGLNDDTSAGIW